MVWERKSKAHHEPPVVEEAIEEIAFTDWPETTPDEPTLVEETPDPREEGAAPVDTYVPRPRREVAPPEI
jgi:hypothetical protein